uniref:uncharacterized protein LOC105351627 n=1 Tax=Fragaria vesca subsp. vesca TaxID=101020 RepID=UPI0005C97AA0|nr:PREDICTED: uncharacterized protein LOC105351627 [Fragaria vesca subsp. vesca]
MLKHKPGCCQGLPNMSTAVILAGGGSGANPNPNQHTPNSRNSFLATKSLAQHLVRVPKLVVFSQSAVVPVAPPQLFTELPLLTGKKRDASVLVGLDLGKRPKGPIKPMEPNSADLDLMLELSLPNFAGSLVISPSKKYKVGRLVCSKNRPREEAIHPWKVYISATSKSMKQQRKKVIGSVKRALAIEGPPELSS